MSTTPVVGSLSSQAIAAPAQKTERNSRKGDVVSRQGSFKAQILPEDIVTLSTIQPAGSVSARKPSQPVSLDEKNALLNYTFSIYG